MSVEEKLKELGLILPDAPAPAGTYLGAKRACNLVFSAGQTPNPKTKMGMIPENLTIEEGYMAARETCLNCLAQLKKVVGDLERIKKVVQVIGFINSSEGFYDQSKVLKGFTDLLIDLFGPEAGMPACTTIPVRYPGWDAIEAWMVVELK